jgi:hypothetical protein
MNQLTLLVQDLPVSALLLSITPLTEGRSIYRVAVPTKLNRGESHLLQDPAGRQLRCFVIESVPQGTGFWVDLKCLDDPCFEAVSEKTS